MQVAPDIVLELHLAEHPGPVDYEALVGEHKAVRGDVDLRGLALDRYILDPLALHKYLLHFSLDLLCLRRVGRMLRRILGGSRRYDGLSAPHTYGGP